MLVTPVLEAGVDFVLGYMPEGLWYDFYTVRAFFFSPTSYIHLNVFIKLKCAS